MLDPIPQDPGYHDFADGREIFGIPNFWDVISNVFITLAGIYLLLHSPAPRHTSPLAYFTLCTGIILTGLGSGYYHWAPDNATLVWDRVPMTVVFSAFFALLLYRYVHEGLGRGTFFIMLPLAVLTVFYWYWTEEQGRGDLRPYAFIQFFPMLCIPLVLWLWKVPRRTVLHFMIMLGLYVLAKVCEHYDDAIYDSLSPLSGHTLKHFLSAGSLIFMGKVLR